MHAILKRAYSIWTVLAFAAALTGLYLTVIYPWMNRWGLTPAEASLALPGDGTEPGLQIISTRAITIQAPADEVWQWLVQIGQDQAGFYSNDWLENLVLSGIHNQDRLHPEWQTHQAGEPIYGAGGAIYQQAQFWPTKAYLEGSMLYLWGPLVVRPVDSQTSRLYLRTYAEPSSLLVKLTYDWMHFVMERGMLLGIQARAESQLARGGLLQALAGAGWMAASLGLAGMLFLRHKGWGWGLIPLAYAVAILIFTQDAWSAMTGFVWWGVIAAGFLQFGRGWWKGLILATSLVVLTLVLVPQAHLVFGLAFLSISAGCGLRRLAANRQLLRLRPAHNG